MSWNLVETCFIKSSSSCKILDFIWLLDCYLISILPPLLHAENYYTIADKIYSKTEASLIQFSWNLHILYHKYKYRACIPNFKPIQIDLITQTWLWSQLAQIFNHRIDFLSWAILHQMWINLEINLFGHFHKDIYLFNPLTKSHLMNLSNTNQFKLDYWAIYPFKHHIASNIAYLSNSINSYIPKWNDQLEIYFG
jgi:hypothetical protein